MERIDLFPTSIHRTKIDPFSWNKDDFIKQSIENYNIDPHRHAKNMPDSEFHTTYRDEDNDKFRVINTETLKSEYSKVIFNFFNNLKLTRVVEYRWNLINISIGKDNWYDLHCHGGHLSKDFYLIDFVMVHYIKFDKNDHNPTYFRNPLIHSSYPHNLHQGNILDLTYSENSTYSSGYQLNTNEDDVIIFPSYLFHGVQKKNNNTEKFRIITSSHIEIKYTENEIYC